MGFQRDPKSDTPPFDEHGCEGEMVRVRAACVCCVADMVRVRAAYVCRVAEMLRVRAAYVCRVAEVLRVRAAYVCCVCACIPGKPILSGRYRRRDIQRLICGRLARRRST